MEPENDWKALRCLLQPKACPHLQVLDLSNNHADDRVLLPLFKLMEESCPELRDFRMATNDMTEEGGKALARLLTSDSLPHFHRLDLEDTGSTPAIEALLEGMVKGRSIPHLHQLGLNFYQATINQARLLGEVLSLPVCPDLESLTVKGNNDWGDEGMVMVIEGLQVGRCKKIKSLGFEHSGNVVIS